MFTGIIQTVGVVTSIAAKDGDVELCIEASRLDLSRTALGDSIACNGCCLTVTRLAEQTFYADVSRETLNVTTLKYWRVSTQINLETALRAGDPLGGHYVSGHVDGVGRVVAVANDGRSLRIELEVARSLGRYVAQKGSICIDGVSLTVNDVQDAGDTRFAVNLVPHTLEQTTLKTYEVGAHINVEIDMIARYLERIRAAP
ncbi:MAG: riboflavin synthase [Candidatus Obscuribacterales bacterium]|nr:riboflavin synthase [Steroidobacteraceae bacterium]